MSANETKWTESLWFQISLFVTLYLALVVGATWLLDGMRQHDALKASLGAAVALVHFAATTAMQLAAMSDRLRAKLIKLTEAVWFQISGFIITLLLMIGSAGWTLAGWHEHSVLTTIGGGLAALTSTGLTCFMITRRTAARKKRYAERYGA